MNYETLYRLFVVKRKVKLLRFLFSLDRKVFEFGGELFCKALELEAFDMAALLFKDFFRVLRNMTSSQLEFSLNAVVGSFGKNNGMLDFKAYLVR